MTTVWLHQSGYQVDEERESFERCLSTMNHDGYHFYEVDICVPVKPAK